MKYRYEHLDKMRQGVEYRHPVRLRDFVVHLRPLTIVEQNDVVNEVIQFFDRNPHIARNRLTEHTRTAIETLKRASTDFDQPIEEARLSEMMLEKMTNAEIHYVFSQYREIDEKCNPILEEMKRDEVLALIEEVKKNPSQLDDLSFLERTNLVRFLIQEREASEQSLTDK